MLEFARTMLGRKVLEGDLPRLIKALEKVGQELEKANDLKEKELNKES